MLVIENQQHFDEVKAFAEKTNQLDKLQAQLDYLATYACPEGDPTKTLCLLYHDSAPASFGFLILQRKREYAGIKFTKEVCQTPAVRERCYTPWINGGLLYHGPHDGYGSGMSPTCAVTLTPTDGWSVHT